MASPPESQSPIKIVINDWNSQIITSTVTGKIFESMGYNVEYVKYPVKQQWGALGNGFGHVQIEIWEGTMSKMFHQLLTKHAIIDAGTHQAITREEWWYPEYVEKLCPELPHWEALNNCAHLFSPSAAESKGVYISGPWEKPDGLRIRALNLHYTLKRTKDADGLWILLEDAIKSNRPILMFNWTPNWVGAKIPGKFIEFPEYSPACETDKTWGINPKATMDCGNPTSGWLKKLLGLGWHQHGPVLTRHFKNLLLPITCFQKLQHM